MKSLKRTLCLVLALVMVLGLFGIASATNFTDDNAIQYKEAVEVVTGIGAIKGMDDGTFAPKGTITRAQAATMVARVALTAGVADNLSGISSSFTDVTVEGGFGWAIPSIEYLVKENVINGMGDGTFNPNGEINGYAVLKMLLCALGYGEKSEYIGDQWTLQVAVDANNNKLTAGRIKGSAALSAPATREEVALYCFNALSAKTVAYSQLDNSYTEKATLGTKVYNLQAVDTGVVTLNGAIDSTAKKDGTTTIDDAVYAIDTDLSLVGHYVKVYYRPAAGTEQNPVAYAVVDISNVVNVAAKDAVDGSTVQDDAQNTKWNKIFGAGVEPVGTNAGDVVGFDENYGSVDDLTSTVVKNGASSKIPAGTYILNESKKIVSYLKPAEYTTGVVTAYKAPTETVPGSITVGATTIPLKKLGDATETVSVYANPAVKDIVMVQQAGANATGFKSITKATPVASGKVTAVDTAKNTLVVDGKTYNKSANYIAATPDPLQAFGPGLVNNTCALFADAAGNICAIALVEEAVTADLAYVVAAYTESTPASYGTATSVVKVQTVNMKGEEVNYTVGLVGVTGITEAAAKGFEKKLVTVSTKYDAKLKGDLATLVEAANLDTQDKTTKSISNKTAATVTAEGGKLNGDFYAADTQFIFVENSKSTLKVTTMTGPQDITGVKEYAYYATKGEKDTSWTIKYVVVSGAAESNAKGLIYVPKTFTAGVTEGYTNASGQPAKATVNYAYENGVYTKILIDATTETDTTNVVEDFFYTYEKNAQGIYTLTKIENANEADAKVDSSSTAHYVYSTYAGGGKQLISIGTYATGAYTAVAGFTDIDASKAKIVDLNYAAKEAAGNLTSDDVLHETVESLLDGKIAFTWHEENSKKVVDTIFYLEPNAVQRFSVNVAVPPAAALILKSDSSAFETCTVSGTDVKGKLTATVTTGVTATGYTWAIKKAGEDDFTPIESQIAATLTLGAADTENLGQNKIKDPGTYLIKCTAAASGYVTAETIITIVITQTPSA